jgi:prefoldin subunit 5
MAKKTRLTKVAEGIGGAMGRADRAAHKMAKAGEVAKKELAEISKQIESMKKQLQKSTRKLKKALS